VLLVLAYLPKATPHMLASADECTRSAPKRKWRRLLMPMSIVGPTGFFYLSLQR
jgi:hypothetical protein